MADYTPPAYNNIALNFSDAYTAPSYDAVALDLTNLSSGGSGTALVGASTLSFAVSQPELWFPWVGTATLSFAAIGDLTINIELSGQSTLSFALSGELTIGYQVQGTVTEMGEPVQRTIRVYDAATGALVDECQSDAETGYYLLDLFDHGDPVYVHCLGSEDYGPLGHGPLDPERL